MPYNTFARLPLMDKMQYAAMLLVVLTIPVSFNIALWATALLALATVAKIVAQRGLRNPALTRLGRAALWAVVAYWLLHVLSLAQGGDMEVGLGTVRRKAVLLIFAVTGLTTDTSYLNQSLLRGLGYALVASVCGVFLFDAAAAVVKVAGGAEWAAVTSSAFDARHHAYVALYVVGAMAFAGSELVLRWSQLRPWLRGCLVGALVAATLFVLLVNSRAGILAMWAVAVVLLVAMCVLHRAWWQAAVLLLLFGGFCYGASHLLPGHSNRLQSTLEDVSSDEPDDARLKISRSALEVAMESPVIGHGVGNYRALLVDSYSEADFGAGTNRGYNAHNQYLESVLSTGLIGLAAMLAVLLLPLYQSWRTRQNLLLVLLLTLTIVINLLFESMLERQMGLLFVGCTAMLMVLAINKKEIKFGQVEK